MSIAEQIVITSPTGPTDEQAAHEAAMIAKADGVAAPEAPAAPASGDRPAWLPEEFNSPEDMAKAFADLKGKQAPAEAAPEVNPDGTPKVAEGAPAVDEVAKELESKGLDLNEFSQEFSTTGTIGPESYAKLEKAGYPKAIVDQYIAGQQALAVNYENEVKSVAGGSDKFGEVSSWAAANLSEAEKVAYNKAIDSGDIQQAKLAVAGITQKYTEANPTEGNLLAGRTGATSGESYASLAQMKADMASPLYKTDPAFRAKVAEKIGRSSIL